MTETLTLRIDLMGVRPPVTRTFKVSSESSMYELHFIIQEVMGWNDCHLYQFDVGGSYQIEDAGFPFGAPKAPGERTIADKRLVYDEYGDSDPVTDVHDVTVSEAFTNAVGTRVKYEYDFGDGWIHHIELVDRSPSSKAEVLPIVISGTNACPPEDCGGPYGYKDLRKVLSNPQHSEYQEMLEWMVRIGKRNFDPKTYNVDEVNNKLRKLNEHIKEFEDNMQSAA